MRAPGISAGGRYALYGMGLLAFFLLLRGRNEAP